MFTDETTFAVVRDGPLTERLARDTALLVSDVARWNGNKTWDQTLRCVTDDPITALRHLPPWHVEAAKRDSSTFLMYGTTWGTPSGWVIWLRADQPVIELVTSWAHELAHVVARGDHGRIWRRMHIMTAPLITRVLLPTATPVTSATFAGEVTSTYRSRRSPHLDVYYRSVSALAEIRGHVRAAERCARRFADRV